MGNATLVQLLGLNIMDHLTLMAVEISLLDQNKAFAVGGPPDQAIAMQSVLAEEMNLPLSEEDTLLRLTRETKYVIALVSRAAGDKQCSV
jgi:hypothetical protein